MITAKCVEKVRDKNGVITDYVLEDYNGIRRTFSSDQVKNKIKYGWLSVLNLKLTSDNKLIDNQGYKVNTADIELSDMAVYRHTLFEGFRHIRSWDESYETLCRALNNGVKITEKAVYEGVNIGIWLSNQRQLFKKGKLPEDKAKKLKELGLGLSTTRKSWDENYETLCRAINNGVKITEKAIYEGIHIGKWVSNQSQLFKKGKLPEDKAKKLKELGLELSTTRKSWDENYETLCRALNNGIKLTEKEVYEGINIGKWISNQRQLFKNGKLPEDKVQKLKSIGLAIDQRKASWDENYNTLCKAMNHGVEITSRTVYEGANIGTWFNTQRQLFKNGKLPENKIQKLRGTGLELDPRKESWDAFYETLCKAISNDVEITSTTVYEGVKIGFWVTNQRRLLKNGNLPEDKAQKLREAGLTLDYSKESWDENYKTLCKALNNGVKIVQTTAYEGVNIGTWLNYQHQLLKNGKLSEDKIEKLRKIGVIKI